MKYETLSTPTIVAKWFNTSPDNIRQTYMHKKPDVYRAQCIAAYVLENSITKKDLELLKKQKDWEVEYEK